MAKNMKFEIPVSTGKLYATVFRCI